MEEPFHELPYRVRDPIIHSAAEHCIRPLDHIDVAAAAERGIRQPLPKKLGVN